MIESLVQMNALRDASRPALAPASQANPGLAPRGTGPEAVPDVRHYLSVACLASQSELPSI